MNLGSTRGSDSYTAKLDEEKVEEMRHLYDEDDHVTFEVLSAMFDVDRTTAYYAVSGKTWKDAGGPTTG